MPTVVFALKAWSGIIALSWATVGLAASAGTASPLLSPQAAPGAKAAQLPSIELLQKQPTLAGTCGGSAFDVNTFINVTSVTSADVKVAAPGVGTIEEFTDETGTNIGQYNAIYPAFHILPFGGGLPPNTKITITVTTYTGPNRTGSVSFESSIVFDCTSGKVVHAPGSAGRHCSRSSARQCCVARRGGDRLAARSPHRCLRPSARWRR